MTENKGFMPVFNKVIDNIAKTFSFELSMRNRSQSIINVPEALNHCLSFLRLKFKLLNDTSDLTFIFSPCGHFKIRIFLSAQFVKTALADLQLPHGYSISYEGEIKPMNESFTRLGKSLA